VREIGAVEQPCRGREAAYCQCVPAGEDLLVALRPDPARAQRQQPGAGPRQERFDAGGGHAERGGHGLDAGSHDQVMCMALEIGRQVEAVAGREHGVFIAAQSLAYRGRLPHVVTAFDARGVGVEAGVKTATRSAQLGAQPLGGTARAEQ
jgi:hypothetical protein